ncbi:Mor transcription activator family protein [Weissella viridescens]|uniref:Mor transcription activator family protein n=1 Tax=Weissella viridescens TaxID=1629 RepID=UPI0040579EE8
MERIEKNLLHTTYLEIFEAVDEDEQSLQQLFTHLSGQQINLPVHLYDPIAVRSVIKNTVEQSNTTDVTAIANKYGYTKRWVKHVVRQVQNAEITDDGEIIQEKH